jgi:hypothetical protein
MVACAALLQAFEAGIETPRGSQMAVWRFLLASDASAVVLHRHELQHPEVARAAIGVLLDHDAGESERDLALAVLRGANVAEISRNDLVTIVDRVLDEGRVRQVAWLIDRVHEERGLTAQFLIDLRDRLTGSEAASVRAASLEVCSLLPRLDQQFALRMFGDGAPAVRVATAEMLERVEAVDGPQALVLVRGQLAMEEHRSVISACHAAVGTLVKLGRRGPPKPPEGDAH